MPEASVLSDDEARRLLMRYQGGDVDAFGELARRHYHRLWPVALRMCGDPDDAADALQEGLIAAMRGVGGFRGDARVSTWLHRIVVNACLDHHRRRKRRPVGPLPEDGAGLVEARNRIEERELALELEAALADLPAEQRAAIVLVDIEGWPVAEAATILDVPVGTVKSRCARGRSKLAASLGHLRNRADPSRVPSTDRDRRSQRGGP